MLRLIEFRSDETLNVHHVYNQSWCEGDQNGANTDNDPECEITYNNNPCGSAFDDSVECNLTAHDSVSTGASSGVWLIWNVTDCGATF